MLLSLLSSLLLINPINGYAQTNTPGVSTIPPGDTPSPGVPPGVNRVTWSFLRAQGTFAATVGSWVLDQGFNSTSGDLTLIGGYFLEDIVQVEISYSSDDSGSLDFGLQMGSDPPVFESGALFSACSGICVATFSPAALDADIFLLDVEADDDTFTVMSITVEFAGDSEAYDVGVDGCPILDNEQINKLDPLYYSQCSACFTEPTPVRENSIPTVTIGSTASPYGIPVIVSGTPVTATPGLSGLPIGSMPTWTLTPVNTATVTDTPVATATPILQVVVFDFTDGGQHGWIPMNVPLTWGDQVNSFTLSGVQSIFDSGVGREYIQIDYPASNPSMVATALSIFYTVPPSPYASIHFDIFNTNGATIQNTITQSTELSVGGSFVKTYNLSSVTLSGWGLNAFSNLLGGNQADWYITRIEVQTTNVVTATPIASATVTSTAAPTSTGAPWVGMPTVDPVSCSVAVFRDDNPVAAFDTEFEIVDYQCYTIVPEIEIDLPGTDNDVDIDGTQYCVTWFEMPVIELLGIQLSLDWLLVIVVAFLLSLVLKF